MIYIEKPEISVIVPVPVLEDVDFSRRIDKLSKKLGIADLREYIGIRK